MNEHHLFVACKSIRLCENPLQNLRECGLLIDGIYTIMAHLKDNGYIESIDDYYRLTDFGNEFYIKNASKFSKKQDWIRPLKEYKIEKIKIDDIFIPHTKWNK